MRVVATGLQFPEGPIAMPDGSVLLVEIARETLSRVTPDGRVEVVAQLPGGPNGAAIGPDGRIWVCNNGGFGWIREHGAHRVNGPSASYAGGWIEIVDLRTGRAERLYDHCGGRRLNGPNDLVFDGQGGFWFTDLGKKRDRDMDRGFVYWARADGSEIREVASGLFTPNGIGLSPDGRTLFVAETDTGRLWSWDIIGPGVLRKWPWPSPNGGSLAGAPGGYTRLDSMAVSASGNVCIAALDSCSIVEVTPETGQVRRYAMPDMSVTNLCFGGPDLRTAFVTLSHMGLLVAADWHEPGLALHHREQAC